jgi:DNA-binding Lrp family transcriptional regulator
MDDTDRTLIRLLRENARASISALAAGAGVSRGTVQNRLARLQADGTIQGFSLRLRAGEATAQVRAIMMVEVVGSRMAAVIRALRGLPELAALHSTNGRWDLVVELAAENLAAFDAVLRRVRLIDGIANSETSLLLSDRF